MRKETVKRYVLFIIGLFFSGLGIAALLTGQTVKFFQKRLEKPLNKILTK